MEEIKKKNTDYLTSINIDVPEHLPVIESLDEVRPRSAIDVASRLSAIAYVVGLAFDAPGASLAPYLEKYGLMPFVSDYEKSLLEQKTIEEQDKVNMSFLPECAQALAWCLGIVELNHFRHCDDDLAKKIPFKEDPSNFISSALLRPLNEIQEQADLLYRMHWYAKNCSLTGNESKLSQSIVSERRKAIDWVYGVEENWDEVPMDT